MATQKIAKKSVVDTSLDYFTKNSQAITFVVMVIALAIGLFFGRQLWVERQNRSAQDYFGSLALEYNQSLQDKNADWDVLRTKFEKGFSDHVRSDLVPYYKNYVVKILLQQGKADEASALLEDLISDAQSCPLLSLYQMESALMNLDSADGDTQKKGKDLLTTLANDVNNKFYDSALFYLGRYYWANNEIDAARGVWQRLVDEQADEKIAPSPWVQQVQEYLSIMIV